MNERVSVVMAVHNGDRFLAEQVASILDQLGPEDELLIVDDASSDGSAEWLASLADPRQRLLVNATNQGIRSTFERGFAESRHNIVFLSDQDDVWMPGKREAFVKAFRRDPTVLVVLSDSELIDAEGNVIAASFMATRGGFRRGWWSTIVRNRYLGCSMAVRRRLFSVALPVPATAPMHDMWLGAIGSIFGSIVYLPATYLKYRRHSRNATPLIRRSVPVMLWRRIGFLYAVASRVMALALQGRWPGRAALWRTGP